jgi:hypothetical protein
VDDADVLEGMEPKRDDDLEGLLLDDSDVSEGMEAVSRWGLVGLVCQEWCVASK